MAQAQTSRLAQSDSTARNYYRVYRAEYQLISRGPQFAYFVSPSSNALIDHLNEPMQGDGTRTKALVLGYDLESVVQVEESEARHTQMFDKNARIFGHDLDIFCLGTVPLVWVKPPLTTSARR